MISQYNLFGLFSKLYDSHKETEMSLEDYLKCCAREPMAYASTAERMLAAIGEPEIVDTSRDSRMGRIFMNRSIRIYPSFADFYGMEETIERIVGYFRHAAQGLEERKQVLYLLGPVFESPLGLFDPIRMGDALEKNYKIPKRRLTGLVSPWALKRLDEFGGDISKFTVVRLHPSRLRQICIAKTEPGDENNQDISSLVGKVDIRKLEFFSQNDADAYGYSGGLNRTSQGLLEFVEMFKAPIKMLHPLLTNSELAGSPCAPGTLDMLSRFCVLSRLKTHENSNLYSKMRAYDGESLKDSDPRAKTVQEYRDAAGVDEGMEG